MSNRRHSRRTFLAAASAAVGSLVWGREGVANRRAPINVPVDPRVELAIATICCDGFGDENFDPSFKMIPKLGFKNVEFNCWYPGTLTLAGLESIKQRCAEHDLTPICVQGNAFTDGKSTDVAHKLWCMQAANILGCRRVKFTGSKRGSHGGLSAVITALRELAPAAEQMGIIIGVENHANNNVENIDDLDQIFGAIGSPNVGLCLDTGHFVGAAVDLDEVVRRFADRTVHVDLKDCQTRGRYKTVNFGDGVADVHGTVAALLEHGYTGYLVVEQAPPVNELTLARDLRRAYDMFQKYQR